MMDNICPICGQKKEELHEQRSWTETDKYHDVKKFGIKQGAGFVAGQIAEAILPGLGTFASVATKSLTGDYYDENHPKNKKHYYTYNYFKCNQCGLEWTRDSDGMKMIENYYEGQYRDSRTPLQWIYWPVALPFGLLLATVIINLIVVLFCFLLEFMGYVVSSFMGFDVNGDFGAYITSTWWPTIGWLTGFASFSWIYYAIYISIVIFFFLLPALRYNSRIEEKEIAKKNALAIRLGITKYEYRDYHLDSKLAMWIGIVIVSVLLLLGAYSLFKSSDSNVFTTASNDEIESYSSDIPLSDQTTISGVENQSTKENTIEAEVNSEPEAYSEPEETYVPSTLSTDVLTDILSLGFPELDKVHRYLERNGYSNIAPTINGEYYAKNCDCDVEEEYVTLFGAFQEETVLYHCTPRNVSNESVFVETEAYRGPDEVSITVWGIDNYNSLLQIIQDQGYHEESSDNGSMIFQKNGKPSVYLYRNRNYPNEAYTVNIRAESY